MLKYILAFSLWFSVQSLTAQTLDVDFKIMLDSVYDRGVPQISVEGFIEKNKHEVFLLDVRENEEYIVSHLKNARNVGYFWFDMRKIYDIPYDAQVILYCSIGTRSEKIARKLINAGYKNVFNLYGGIFEWVNSGQPVYNSKGVQTSEIHTYNKELARWLEKGTKVN